MPHIPVLLQEVLECLGPQPGEFFVDGTADGGGHAKAILERIGPTGRLLALDWDKTILAECKRNLGNPKNVDFVNFSYARIPEILKKKKLPKIDGLLLDLGFSSLQTDETGRGFSFRKEKGDEPLLMTYSDEMTPLRDLLPNLKEVDLTKIIRELGGERFAGRVARVIHEASRKKRIETSGELAEIVRKVLPKHYERGRIDPATRTFQALRIYANQELENLKNILEVLPEIINTGGRVGIISFHSLEDRIVKQSFKELVRSGQFTFINKKPIGPSRQEILQNIRSRSAKLRAIQFSA